MKQTFFPLFSLLARILPLPVKQVIYRFPPLARLIRGAMNAAVEPGLSEVEIAAGDLKGYKILLNLKAEKSRWLGTYEPELAQAARAFLKPGMTVYDVGANIGYVSLLLAHHTRPDGRVFAFEALPANAERIRRNVALNALEHRITLIEAAVAAQGGEIAFLVHSSAGMGKAVGSAGRHGERYQAEIRVRALSLDEFVYEQGNPPPDLVKMDIEGGEVLALPGMKRILNEHHPILFLELHGPESEQAAWHALTEAGYTLHQMSTGYPVITRPERLGWKAYLVATFESG
ncbi:MAG: FkbM family methyltransferase [Anaerolineales bacterium]|nr:FkbM family methyltransferase [Anaerolineales bacterium]MCX7756035.1 FkbM family methyltransferase [Anaerolineales bacterium]MDW8277043.1 FkbM family methyltransferase [Anaerolineales bacterium]